MQYSSNGDQRLDMFDPSNQIQMHRQQYNATSYVMQQSTSYKYPTDDVREWNQTFPHLSMTPQEVQEFNPFNSSNQYNPPIHHHSPPDNLAPQHHAPTNYSQVSSPPPSNYSPNRQQIVSSTLSKINSTLKNFQIPLLTSSPTELIIPTSELTSPPPYSKNQSSSESEEEEEAPQIRRTPEASPSRAYPIPGSPLSELFKKESDLHTLAGGPSNRKFINVSPYFRYSQRKAAKLLGIPCSTLR